MRLWLEGTLPDGPAVAIVGARAATPRATEAASALATRLGEAGVAIVSGGAIGVDAAAHRGALAAGAPTVVVVGTGIDVVYPREHVDLFRDVVRRGGAILSDVEPGTAVHRFSFPQRNRLIAALANVCVVVEAGEASGTLHTARWAARLGRPLVVLAGSPGCEALAAGGAILSDNTDALVTAVREQLRAPAADPVRVPAPRRAPTSPALEATQLPLELDPIGEDATRLQAILSDIERDIPSLAQDARLSVNAALAAAIDLELRGLARRVPGGRYLRSAPTVSMRNETKRRPARRGPAEPDTSVTRGRGR